MTQKRQEPVKKSSSKRPPVHSDGMSSVAPNRRGGSLAAKVPEPMEKSTANRGPASKKKSSGKKGSEPPKRPTGSKGPVTYLDSNHDSYANHIPYTNQESFPNQDLFSNREPQRRNISSIHRAEHMRAIQRKKSITSALFLGIIVILVMVLTAAAILYVTDYVKAKPNYSFISMGTIEHSVGATALIIRDEKTYTSPSEGTLSALATEGSRVAKNQELAMIIPAGLEDTSASLRNVQKQIVELQRQLMEEGKGSGADTIYSEADTDILPIINMIRTDLISDNSYNLMSYSSSIQVLMDKRDSDLQSIDFQDEQLSALISSKKELENTLSLQSVTLYAEIPGIVSYRLDGMENELNSTSITSMLPGQCTDYIASSKATIPRDLNIEANDEALRICQNDEQYLAAIVKGYTVMDFPVDEIKTIRVPSEGILIEDCKIIRSVQSQDGVFVVFQTTSQVERLLDRRIAEIEIVMSETDSGLRVPLSALIDADFETGYAKILYNSSGYARKLLVKVIDHDREYAIIAPLDEDPDMPNTSTIIITNPNTISEGDKVEQ